MEEEPHREAAPELQAQLILLAASHHNLELLRTLLRDGSASVQDPERGFTPLHAAIAACDPAENASSQAQDGSSNGATDGPSRENVNSNVRGDTIGLDVEAADKTVRILLQNGAIWNDVDAKNETPGCLALRLGLRELYEIMVDAGVRAEMLLNRLDEYEQLQDNDDVESEDEDAEKETTAESIDKDTNSAFQEGVNGHTDNGSIPQMVASTTSEGDLHNENYLQSSLRFQDGRILDDSHNSVMMAWETDIMKRTADLLTPAPGLRILNVGHGMGIIDAFFQEKSPITHHIIEAHPSVIRRMKKDGWDTKTNVTIHEGRWQDVIPKIMELGILFDAVYFDTFAEDYRALRDFFSDFMLGLLDDGGKWSFFNGLGADRQICYDVYGKVVEMDLFEAGFDTVWDTIQVPEMENGEWEGIKRPYWALRVYRLPVCEFIG